MKTQNDEQLFNLIMGALKSVRESAIGEGNFGIVIDKFPSKKYVEYCGKYHKFQYDPNEYEMLTMAYEMGKQVPKPHGEWPQQKIFAMKRVIGRNLEELGEYKFSEDVIEDLKACLDDFCRDFVHGDLRTPNVMLEDVEIKDGMVVSGTPFVIDLGKTQVKTETNRLRRGFEYESLLQWLNRRSVAVAA